MERRLGLLAWLVPLGAAAVVAALGTRDPADLPYFVDAARTLFSADWADTFFDPALQVGPIFLALVGVADRVGGAGLLAYGVQVGVAALVVFNIGRLLEARANRPFRAGALLGLSAGFELWGVLGAPVLLLAPAWKAWVRGAAAQGAVTAGLYLPFVLAGEFRMFDLTWKVENWTLVRFLVPAGDEFPWTLRLVQGAAAIVAGAALALVLKRSPRALWAVPLGIVAVRVLFDPALYSRYWLGLETVALAAATDLVTGLRAPYVAAATRAWSRPNP
jgi:hypothetical protein